MTTPTPGFEFPINAQDRIEATLRGLTKPNEPVRSVRPERQKVVVPQTMEAQSPTPSHMVKTTQAPATPMTTAEYVSIDLPSRFTYYPFKDLYIKPFRNPHLAKLAKADSQSSMQLTAEVVSSVLATPNGDTNIAFKLSITDLNAVMYWLRMNSFTKASMAVTSECANPAHTKRVAAGEATKESLKITTTFTNTDVEIKYLDEKPDPEVFCIRFPDDGDKVLHMRPETVMDAIHFLDHPDWTDEEFQYKVRIISYLDFETFMPEVEWTMERKLQFFDEMLSLDDTLLIDRFSKMVDGFGIVENVATKCMECGASGTARLSFDARSFLSPSF